MEDDPLLGAGADADPVGQRVAARAAEAEDQARAQPAGIERRARVEAGEIEVDDPVAGEQLGQGFPAPQRVERSRWRPGHGGRAAAAAPVAGIRRHGHRPVDAKTAAAAKTGRRAQPADPTASVHLPPDEGGDLHLGHFGRPGRRAPG